MNGKGMHLISFVYTLSRLGWIGSIFKKSGGGWDADLENNEKQAQRHSHQRSPRNCLLHPSLISPLFCCIVTTCHHPILSIYIYLYEDGIYFWICFLMQIKKKTVELYKKIEWGGDKKKRDETFVNTFYPFFIIYIF